MSSISKQRLELRSIWEERAVCLFVELAVVIYSLWQRWWCPFPDSLVRSLLSVRSSQPLQRKVHTPSWTVHSQCLHRAGAQSPGTFPGSWATWKEHPSSRLLGKPVLSPHITVSTIPPAHFQAPLPPKVHCEGKVLLIGKLLAFPRDLL